MIYHNIVGTKFPAIYVDDRQLGYLKYCNVRVKAWSLSAGGKALELFTSAINGKSEAVELIFSGSTKLENRMDVELNSVNGWMFKNDSVCSALIVNYGNVDCKVAVPHELLKMTLTTYSGDLKNYVVDNDELYIESERLNTKLIQLPPYSISVIK